MSRKTTAAAALLLAFIPAGTAAQTLQQVYANSGSFPIIQTTPNRPVIVLGNGTTPALKFSAGPAGGHAATYLGNTAFGADWTPLSTISIFSTTAANTFPLGWGDLSISNAAGQGLAVEVDDAAPGVTRVWTKGASGGTQKLVMTSQGRADLDSFVLLGGKVGLGLPAGNDPVSELHIRDTDGNGPVITMDNGPGLPLWQLVSTPAGSWVVYEAQQQLVSMSMMQSGTTMRSPVSIQNLTENAALDLVNGAGQHWSLSNVLSTGQFAIYNPDNQHSPLRIHRTNNRVIVEAVEFPDGTVQTSAAGGGGFWAPSGANIYSTNAGAVAIGTTDPGSFKLAVNGAIGAREVRVTTTTPFPDFVFHDDYLLPPLDDVAASIRREGHLPGIPRADEVHARGLNVGEMEVLLLQKVEELTLYAIALKRENDELNARVARLEQRATP